MDMAARAVALVALVLGLVYPVQAFMRLDEVPLEVRLLWPAVAIAAWIAPSASLRAFVAAAPLTPMLPAWLGWPAVVPAEPWLLALLAAATTRVVLGRRPWWTRSCAAVPLGGFLLLLVATATASLIVTLYPFHLAHDGILPLLRQVHEFARRDFILVQSQRHLFASITAWAVTLEGLALLWLVVTEPRGAAGVMPLLKAAVAGCSAVAAIGLWQWWTGRGLLRFWVEQNPDLTRINATFTDVNGLASYLALMVPVALALSAGGQTGLRRWGWRAAAALSAVAIVFTASRAAWVSLAAGLLGYGWAERALGLGGRTRWNGWRAALGVLVTVLVGLGVLTAFATVRDVRLRDQDSYTNALLYTLNLNAPLDERLKGRLALWSAAGAMVRHAPVFGIGVGRFYKDVAHYAVDQAALPRPQENAHNYFLQVAAELGLVGLLGLLGLLVAAILPALRAAVGSDPRRPVPPSFGHGSAGTSIEEASRQSVALGTAIGLGVYLLTWLTGHPLLVREGQFAFWPMVGAAALLGAPTVAGSGCQVSWSSWSATRRRTLPYAVALGLVAIAASVPWRASSQAARVDLSRMPSGLHDPEVDAHGRPFRWTLEHAVFYVPRDAQVFTLELRSVAPFAQWVTVVLDGQVVDRLRLDDHAWRRIPYRLPQHRSPARYHRFELDVDPPWRAPRDPRILGVMLGEWAWK